jgi:hypothetical protein
MPQCVQFIHQDFPRPGLWGSSRPPQLFLGMGTQEQATEVLRPIQRVVCNPDLSLCHVAPSSPGETLFHLHNNPGS